MHQNLWPHETFSRESASENQYAFGTAAQSKVTNGCKGVFRRVTVLDLSAYIGLIAVGLATANILIGLMIYFSHSPVDRLRDIRFYAAASVAAAAEREASLSRR